jgi:NhaP-type Na+/H+ or K+/H+ antiporter
MTVIVILGRIAAVWISHGLFSLCSKKADISLRELCFISYGGMIRGAIAFGLVLKIPDNEPEVFKERGAIVTTTLALVIITTLFFGTFMKFA